jgi:hypothetical protein
MLGTIKKIQGITKSVADTVNSVKAATNKPTNPPVKPSTGSGPLGFITSNIKNNIPAASLEAYRKNNNIPAKSFVFKKGGSVSSASKRADGIAIRGKTRA